MAYMTSLYSYSMRLQDRASRYGNFLGRGRYGFAVTLSKNSNRVVKFSNGRGDAWPIYAAWCFDAYQSGEISSEVLRHFMKVYSLRDNVSDSESFTVGIVEKLIPFDEDADNDDYEQLKINELIRNFCNNVYLVTGYDMHKDNHKAPEWLDPTHTYPGLERYYVKCREEYVCSAAWYKDNKTLVTAYLMLEKFYSSIGGFALDIHDGNVMYRPSDNSLVITDPFAYHVVRLPDNLKRERANSYFTPSEDRTSQADTYKSLGRLRSTSR